MGEEVILIYGNQIVVHLIFMRICDVFYFVDLFIVVLLVYLCFKMKSNHGTVIDNKLTYFGYVVPKDADPNNPSLYRFEVPTILNTISNKKFISVALTTEPIENQKKLDLIRFEARRMKYTKDTNQVIRVFIPDSSKYGTFLRLLYIMNEDQQKYYFEYRNWFYILGEISFKRPEEKIKEVTPIAL